MTVSAETLRLHLDYTSWATARLLEAAASLSPEELTRDFDTADKSVAGTLGHIFAADRVWISRVEGVTLKAFITPEDRELPYLQREWPPLLDRWRKWAGSFTDEMALECLTYRDLKGNEWKTPNWQIILHVVNHGTHHRGQVAGFLRTMGKIPPPLDLIAYYRVLGQPAQG
jgi:uncharacterized damage-inducible protein DinB